MSVVFHEVAHGFIAEKLGDPTARLEGRITLNPLAHLDWIGSVLLPGLLVISGAPFIFGWAKPVPFNPYRMRNPRWGGALVAAAGPLTNLIIAAVASVVLHVLDPSSSLLVYLLQGTIITNIALAVFNLFPIPPLDGHHILFALLPDSLDHLKYTLRKFSWPIVIFFIIFGWRFVSPVILWLYQFFV